MRPPRRFPVVIPYLFVQVLVSGHTSVYGSNSSALYGRTASVADCDRLTLTDAGDSEDDLDEARMDDLPAGTVG